MRVPGGDVVERVAVVRDATGRAVVLEFVNQTPAPVSLALAVIPMAVGADRRASGSRRVRPPEAGEVARAAVSGSQLVADGRVALELGRTPRGATATADGDVWPTVRAEPAAGDCEVHSRTGRAAAAAVVPLASRIALRVVLPVDGGPVGARAPEQISAGWRAVVARAATVDLPDDSASRAWSRGVAASILAAGVADVASAARAAVVLDRVGLADEADRGRDAVLAAAQRATMAAEEAALALRALASRRLRTGRVSGLAGLAGPLAAAAGDRLDACTLQQVAAVLESEAPGAARDARRMLAEIAERDARAPAAAPRAARSLQAALRRSAAFGGDCLAGIEAVLDRLVAEEADRLVVAPDLPGEWLGAPLDVGSLATRHGRLSFSVRWHGSRPALLWEAAPDGGSVTDALDGATLRCGLDPFWSTDRRAGDALLGSGA